MTKPLKLYLPPLSAYALALIFLTLTLFHTANLQAAPSSDSNQQRQQIAKLTAELNRLLKSYRQASSAQQPQISQQLETIAQQRQQLLSEVVGKDPAAVLKYAIPDKIQAQFPATVQETFEKWVHVRGELEIYFEDHEQHENSRLQFYLKQEEQRFPLAIAGKELPVKTSGQQVRIQGVVVSKSNKPVIATNDAQVMLAAGGSGDPEITSSTAELSNTFGEQRTAVFLVNFQDKPADKPWTKTAIDEQFFVNISDFFKENSYDQTWLTGDVLGWYTLPIDSTSCSPLSISDAAQSAATSNNVDLSQYDRFVYVFPQNSCTWSGYATVGGQNTNAWVHNAPFTGVPSHELGHNLGLLHSRGLNCEGDVTDTNCVQVTYGDQLDTMGSNQGHFNAYQKERLGWLGHNQSPPIVTVEQDGSYAIELYETASNNAKALKVFKDIDPTYGFNRWYYLEFRQAVGEDAFIAGHPFLSEENISNGVTIHMGTESQADNIFLLDMTPDSSTSSSQFADLDDPALVSGNSYTDSATGLTITTNYTDSQSATVYVSHKGTTQTPCSLSNPIVNVSPTESQWVSAGSQVEFSVSVTNQDSSACSVTDFDISAAIPSNWSADAGTLTLAPGETSTTALTITSPEDAVDDFYDITLTASNHDNSSYSSSTSVTYVVSSDSGNTPPDAVNDSVILPSVEPVIINVLTNDSDPDADAFYISSAGNASKGDVSVNADGSVIYTPAKRFKDKDSFTYTITDGLASDSAVVSIQLQSSTNDTGNTTKGGGNGGGKGNGGPKK